MKILYSATSSKGNCSVIESYDGTLLCIDAGLKYKNVNREIGYRLHECSTLLLTHGHGDHISDTSDFLRIGMGLYCSKGTFDTVRLNKRYNKIAHKESFCVTGFKIVPFELKHSNSDGSNCPCFGFLIQDIASKDKMLWCTDTKMIPYAFPPLERYCIEANFLEQESYFDDMSSIEKSVEIRRVQSHMSVETAVDFLKKQDLSKCKEIRLLHLSNSMTGEERERIIPYVRSELGMEDMNVVI